MLRSALAAPRGASLFSYIVSRIACPARLQKYLHPLTALPRLGYGVLYAFHPLTPRVASLRKITPQMS